jgi:hypothetical protein
MHSLSSGISPEGRAGTDCKCNEDEHRNLSEYIRVVLFLLLFLFFLVRGFILEQILYLWSIGEKEFGLWKLGWGFYCKEKM